MVLKHYLKGNMYSNATGGDLWESIGHVAKKPVSSMMNTWIMQVGFPLVEFQSRTLILI